MTDRKRMVVTGRQGQVVLSLLEAGKRDERFQVIPLGRPELDLSIPDTIKDALARSKPDVIISAAAYTAVDQAERDEDAATLVNGAAPGMIAEAAAELGVPIVHLSTDYVFDGAKGAAYLEADPVEPVSAYGRSKLAGEHSITALTGNHAILRTAWVYSPFARNFLKTMLELAKTRESIDVVSDQIGNPTSALDIAHGILVVASNLLSDDDPALRGIFHMTANGDASWADFAVEIFARSAAAGGPTARVNSISSDAYPTHTKRPANSRLDCSLLERRHGIRLPDWRRSTADIVQRLMQT